DHCKWDPQVGDVGTLARFALVLPADEWRRLARLAERLAAEMDLAERELLLRPTLMRRLGLPEPVLRALASDGSPTPAAARVVRFDFHPTPDGWRISEANSDVPGGYTEASSFPALMAEHFHGAAPAGGPAPPPPAWPTPSPPPHSAPAASSSSPRRGTWKTSR